MPEAVPIALAGAEGAAATTPFGGAVTFKALASQTDRSLTAFEAVNPAGAGPPLHVHRAHDEIIYVLEGTLRFRLGDDVRPGPAGSFVFLPRGLQHTWQNVGDGDARFLACFIPGAPGMEQFFGAIVEADDGVFQTVSSGGDMDLVGPPLAESHPL